MLVRGIVYVVIAVVGVVGVVVEVDVVVVVAVADVAFPVEIDVVVVVAQNMLSSLTFAISLSIYHAFEIGLACLQVLFLTVFVVEAWSCL